MIVSGAEIVMPTFWILRIRDAQGRTVQGGAGNNSILLAGRGVAMRLITGLQRPASPFEWLGIGGDDGPTNVTSDVGVHVSIPRSDDANRPFRKRGTWSPSGGAGSFFVSIPGTEIEATIQEIALYPNELPGDAALYRYVNPSPLVLTASNTFEAVGLLLP